MEPVDPVLAYIDPGIGSILIQALIAGVAGAAMFFKLYWRRIRSWFHKRKSPKADEPD